MLSYMNIILLLISRLFKTILALILVFSLSILMIPIIGIAFGLIKKMLSA